MKAHLAPITRILLRYGVGVGIGGSIVLGNQLAADTDLVLVASLAVGALVEVAYVYAKRKGWAT